MELSTGGRERITCTEEMLVLKTQQRELELRQEGLGLCMCMYSQPLPDIYIYHGRRFLEILSMNHRLGRREGQLILKNQLAKLWSTEDTKQLKKQSPTQHYRDTKSTPTSGDTLHTDRLTQLPLRMFLLAACSVTSDNDLASSGKRTHTHGHNHRPAKQRFI